MLTGEKVRLRALEPTDVEREYTWINDREVTRYLVARYPLSHEDERRWIEGSATNGFAGGLRLAIETEAGAHIGNIGLENVHPEDRKAALGILIGEKEHWSQGYGRDAIVTLLRFAFHEMNLHKVYLHVLPSTSGRWPATRNAGSRKRGVCATITTATAASATASSWAFCATNSTRFTPVRKGRRRSEELLRSG